MKYLILVCLLSCQIVTAQKIQFSNAVFKTGDDAKWAMESFNDKDWNTIKLNTYWETQGYDKYDGFAWYRLHFYLPSSLKDKAVIKDKLEIFLTGIDDADISYLNGIEIGRTGRLPDDPNGYKSGGRSKERHYTISYNLSAIHWDADNTLAIRVFDGGGTGGFFGDQYLRILEPIDYVSMDAFNSSYIINQQNISKQISFQNNYSSKLNGSLTTTVKLGDSLIKKYDQHIILQPGKTDIVLNLMPSVESASVNFLFTEDLKKASITTSQEIPYVLTPLEKSTPKINNAASVGCKLNQPFQLSIAATGKRPLTFEVKGLPEGLLFNASQGIISGKIITEGKFSISVTATNKLGKDEKKILILVGADQTIVTPPMGWNSWNCWGLAVSQERVKSSAMAMINSGLANHGWNYINIDDGWEAAKRSDDGHIIANEKFPDMKSLGDYLHNNGLKFGIYSSPGSTTCGGYLGSYQQEISDANTYANWGVDYLKYDLCSYRKLFPAGLSLAQLQEPYFVMAKALKNSGRDILYSLCEYGMQDVWKWGKAVNGNVWRTTGDITDTWSSVKNIGFSQEVPASYNGPNYGYGDPDMLIVGFVGWGDHLHLTKLTASEQYTHISLWSLLSAPLMLGCDLARMDPFTYNLLSNDEVLAIDQDIAGKGPKKMDLPNDVQVWVKDLADGNKAVGIFNLSDKPLNRLIKLNEFGMNDSYVIRDLWRQKNLPSTKAVEAKIPSHGVLLLKIIKKG
jgi:hypothetical protein